MYIPLNLWDRFMNSDTAKGKKGGISIGWSNCSRRFNNTEFTTLLASGWIGSTAGQSNFLSQIIPAIIEGDRMLVLAITSRARTAADYLRDDLGRFATEDDPLASR
jgi:hypothetical protein